LNTGDTLRGQVRYKENLSNPGSVLFKTGPGAAVVTYSTTGLRYMEASGQDPYERGVLRGDTVLFRVLVTGAGISLYELDSATSHYYIKEQGSYSELVYREGLSSDGTRVEENDEFRNQLKRYAAGAGRPGLEARIEHTNYSRDALVSIVEAINGSTPPADPMSGHSGVVFRPYVMAGVIFARLRQYDASNYGMGVPVRASAPSAAIGVDLVRNRDRGDFASRLEVAYWAGSFSDQILTSNGDYIRYTLKTSTIVPSLSAMFYFCRQKHLRLYFTAGLGADITSYPSSNYTVIPYGGTVYTVDVHNHSFRVEPQFRLGGQIIQKLSLELMWVPYTQINNSSYGHANISMYGLRASYHLFGSH
jgi:hypothetical protein